MMKRLLRLGLLYLLALSARLWPRPAMVAGRVLYIKPDHLGDLLLATPVLAELRRRCPTAQITALIGPWSRPVLANNPTLDTILECPFPGFARSPRQPGVLAYLRPYLTLLRYALLLRAGGFAVALIGRDDHWWGAALAALAGIPCRIGFAVPECRPFLTAALPWQPTAHVTQQGLALVAALAPAVLAPADSPEQHTNSPATRFMPGAADQAWAREWLRAQGLAATRLVVLHPGSAGPAKHWLPERWAALADALTIDGYHIVITGGPDEVALAVEVARQMQRPALLLAGATSLGQLAALFQHTRLVLGVDSLAGHLAVAVGTPTIHLFGPGNPQRFGPWGNPQRQVVLQAGLWCSPCGVFSACPRGLAQPECMAQLGTAEVLATARRLLASTQTR